MILRSKDSVTGLDTEDLARFEGEGGLQAPEPATARPEEPNILNTKLYVGNLAATGVRDHKAFRVVAASAKCKVLGTSTWQIA
jgi:hypothetical protein